jgi:hypothetical protein
MEGKQLQKDIVISEGFVLKMYLNFFTPGGLGTRPA